MKPKFNKKREYDSEDIIDEIVRVRLWEDYKLLCYNDNAEELYVAYNLVLEYISQTTDKRLKKLVK